mgnify:CR=1 FL=1
MQVVDIQSAEGTRIFCPLCGTQSLGPSGPVGACSHLVYVSSSDTLDAPWHDSRELGGSETDLVTFLAGALPSSAFAIRLPTPAPSGSEVLLAYEVKASR